MYIGEAARKTGTTPKAIRLYESLGLIPAPARRGKYRIYANRDLVLIHTIRRGLAVGLSLKEIKAVTLARSHSGGHSDIFPLALVTELIENKRREIRTQIKTLIESERQLGELQEEIDRTFGQPHAVVDSD